MSLLLEFIKTIWNFLLNSSWAIPLAVIVFLTQKFFIPQILEFRELVKRAKYDLVYYANVVPSFDKNNKLVNKKEIDSVSKELRVVASKLRAGRDNIPFYRIISFIKLVPNRTSIDKTSTGFIGWSNSIYLPPGERHIYRFRYEIALALDLKDF